MNETVKADYPCSQKDLYSVLETIWGNYSIHLTKFTNYKAFYTAAYKTTAMTAVSAAKALPDDDARSGVSEMMHIALTHLGEICTDYFQDLKGYIESAYPAADEQEVQFVIAGQNYYRDATRGDWESLEAMNSSAKNYLGNPINVTALTANNNMPASFVTTLKTASDNFDAKYAEFKLASETSVETANKVKANNLCYSTAMKMAKDAQRIFRKEPEIGIKFVFKNLLDMINPPVAGIKGLIKDSMTNTPLGNANLTAQLDGDVKKVIEVSDEGEFGVQLKEGNYTISAGADGYASQTIEVELKLTGLKTINIELVKI